MSAGFSLRYIVTIILASVAIISGLVLLAQSRELTPILDELPVPYATDGSEAYVFPSASAPGTLFAIQVQEAGVRDEQDVQVVITSDSFRRGIIIYDDGQHNDGLKGDGLYGGWFDSTTLTPGTYYIEDGTNRLASFEVITPQCETIQGDESAKISITFVPSGYDSIAEFRQDVRELITGEESLFTIEPFASRSDEFAVTLAHTQNDLSCEIGCGKGIRGIVCCDNTAVLDAASQCSHDEVVVVLNNDEFCGSSSTYAKVCADQSVSKLVLAHELGHSFGGLADEYVYQGYSVGTIDAPNCDASNSCDSWNSVTDGCYEGCTYPSLYRSSETSLMATYVPYFNVVSELALNNIIDGHIAQTKELEAGAPSYYTTLTYNNGAIQLTDVARKPTQANTEVITSNYRVNIEKADGTILYEAPLPLPLEELPLPDGETVPSPLTSFELPLALPYYASGEVLRITENDDTVAVRQIGGLAQQCGNNQCDIGENYRSCRKDCTIESDAFCQSAGCDPDCPGNCAGRKTTFRIAGIIVLLIGVVGLALAFIKGREQH